MRVLAWLSFIAPALFLAQTSYAQTVTTLIVEIRTMDERFAGTDDSVHLQIGGRDFPLDDPDRDDFERNNTDRFTFDLSAAPLDLEIVRGVGQISVTKIEDSFFGGGWGFRGITIWAGSTDTEPLYQNASVDRWLDGDDLEWTTTLGEEGWNVPEPPPFPPCSGTIIIFAAPGRPAPAAGGADTDSDCDGTPDNQDGTFDTPTDSDGDGLPDLYETQTGSNPNDPDSDHDGWADGRNRRSMLVLTRIECDDENEDIGSDELYLTSEDVRYPKSFDLDGYWSMNDGTVRSPGVVVDVRTLPANTPAVFSSRMKLRESDFKIFEKPFDDTFKSFDLEWDDDGTATIEHDGDDAHYKLTFRWFTVNVRDPKPLQDSDNDSDGLPESKEAQMSLQAPGVQRIQVAGHNGLADPEHRELWVEVDHSGSEQALIFDAKQMVASQFAYHDIFPRFDDGWFGNTNNGALDYVETLTPSDLVAFRNDDTKFWHERRDLPGPGGQPRGAFRYALLADNIENAAGAFGEATCSGGCRFIIAGVPLLGHTMVASAQPIIFMHELGHTLTLCHRVGDKDPQNPPTCPAPGARCADFCAIGQESTTAMGSEQRSDIINPIVAGATTGIGAGVVIGGLIGGVPGAIVGGILGGIVGAVTGVVIGADFYQRDIDYHIREWLKLHVEPA
jgi:hypothetical protein